MITAIPETASENRLVIEKLQKLGCALGQHVQELLEDMPRCDDESGPRSLFHTGIVAPTCGPWSAPQIVHDAIYQEASARGYKLVNPRAVVHIVEGIQNDGSIEEFHHYLGMKPILSRFQVPMIFAVFKTETGVTVIARNASPSEIHGNNENWLFIH
jgi:hypothetical protein